MSRALNAADLRVGLTFYAVSAALVLLSVWFGHRFVGHPPDWIDDEKDYLGALCRYDGNWYLDIAANGYNYDPSRPSNVAFFPVYPMTVRMVSRLSGCRLELASVLVAHTFLAASFVLLRAYARLRSERTPTAASPEVVLLLFALFPPTFFFRLGYTESMFVFWCVLALFGHERGWHPAWLALIAGVAVGTRATGAALTLVTLVAVWQRSSTRWRAVRTMVLLGPLCAWGLIAFVVYQAYAFGEPLAFVKAQAYWSTHPGQTPLGAVISLLTLEPVWNTYNPESERLWSFADYTNNTPFSLQLANPVYFLLACAAVGWGCWRRSLTPAEWLLAAGLLLIPYVTRAYPNSMGSFGRFSAVVMPVYLVLGDWLRRLPSAWIGLIAAVLTAWLVAYSALFGAAWWLV